MRVGWFLSSEEYSPEQLLAQAQKAAAAGFSGFWISDHFHPWLDSQGQSPFVWSMIGALSQITDLPIGTAVTCPTTRMHPAIVAQAAATSAVMTSGRFTLGIGTGEALNESIVGQVWPPQPVRLEMLAEALDVMRKLWTGQTVTHLGKHYTVHHARIYTLPDVPPPVYVSGFGPRAVEFAARQGDGYVSTRPDAELVKLFAGNGGAGKPVQGGTKACFATTAEEGAQIAHEKWRSSGVPGELAQNLAAPEFFDQASALVTPEMMRKEIVCGPDPALHIENLRKYADAGFTEVYVAPVGPNDLSMVDFYASEILPEFEQAGFGEDL